TGYVPNNQTGTVSSADLIKYGRYAGASYKVLDNSWTCLINCVSPDTRGTAVDYHWDVSGTTPSFGFVAHKHDTKEIIVSWRGSTILMDWIQDFNFVPVPWPQQIAGSKVHTGFLQTYRTAASKIKSVVAGLAQKYPDYKIKLVGHSLGGAQAHVMAADLALEHPEWASRMELWTFGSPRVGNAEFASWLAQQPFPIYRVVFKGDLVPRVPLQEMGFMHVAQEVWYTPSGETKFCGSNGENKDCQNSLNLLQWSVINHLQYPGLSYQLLYWAIGQVLDI
ncbi:hypothetical protein GGI12_006096, partial [Dipsacomyces acuminosporus]